MVQTVWTLKLMYRKLEEMRTIIDEKLDGMKQIDMKIAVVNRREVGNRDLYRCRRRKKMNIE